MFADDTQLNHSESPENDSDSVRSLQDCVKDIGLWMEKTKQLNNYKTKTIHFSSSSSINTTLPHPQTIFLSNTDVEFSGTVRNLGFIFDSDLSIKQHIIKTWKTAYLEIRRISSIRQHLTEDATKTLVNSWILSRLDYCNSLLAGYPQTVIKQLQQVQNSAAKLILKSRRAEHTTLYNREINIKSSLALPLSTWLNLSRSTSLLGLCALLRMIKFFASPSSKNK